MFWKASKRERHESDDEHFGVGPYRALPGRSHRLCRAAAGAAINMVCAALLAVTPPRPDLVLMTARICLKLRRPRRAYDAVAEMNAIDARQVADPDRTAGEITNLRRRSASAACERRRRMCCAAPLLWRRTPPLPGLH